MPIPESQLETWSHQGSIAQSSNTYNTIKNVLETSTTPYASKNFKVFLQGSYGNDTNIYAESDVDIVIRLDDCFFSDLDTLSEEEKAARKERVTKAKDALSRSVGIKGDHVAGARAAIKTYLQRLNEPNQPDDARFEMLIEAPFKAPEKKKTNGPRF